MNSCGPGADGTSLASKDLKSRDVLLYSYQSPRPEDEEVTQTLHRFDAEFEVDGIDGLRWVTGAARTRIGIVGNDGAVTLAGEVDTLPAQLLACAAAQRVRGVAAVAGEMSVREGGGPPDQVNLLGWSRCHCGDAPPPDRQRGERR